MTIATRQELVVLARRLVDELVRAEQLEVRRAGALATDLAAYVTSLGRAPSGDELDDWLGAHKQVEELYASRTALEAVAERLFRPAPVAAESVAVASEPELERQLRETLEPDAYLVYADWLQERGDPFGELIALGVAASSGETAARKRFEAFLEQHERLFLRGIKNELGSLAELRWHHGFITHVGETGAIGLVRWRKLFELRVASLVRSIELRGAVDPEVEALIAERAPALRELRLRGDALPARLLESPALETLALETAKLRIEVGTLPATLVRLELHVEELERADDVRALGIRELVLHRSMWRVAATPFVPLAGLALPALERLELAGLDGTLADTCDRVLAHLAMPRLASLAVRRVGGVRAADLARLAALPCAGQIARLVLQDLALTDGALAALAPLAAHRKLAHLDVDGNELTPAGVALARTFATEVVVGKQRPVGTAAEDAIRTFARGRFDAGEAIAIPAAWRSARITGELRWARYTGTRDYELFVSADLARYQCTCPSPYQPCKHVIALALVATRTSIAVATTMGIALEDY